MVILISNVDVMNRLENLFRRLHSVLEVNSIGSQDVLNPMLEKTKLSTSLNFHS